MKKIFRYIVIGVVAAIAFLVAITAIFLAVFDANAYKQDLSDLVREETGRDLQFHGDVGLTLFPELGMELGALSFSNAQGFGAQPMIKVNHVSISVDLTSLIALSPEVDQLVLRDLEVNLQKNAAGVTNWDDLLPKADSQLQTDSSGGSTDEAKADESSGFALKAAFGGLDLQNIKLLWQDDQSGSEFRINDLDVSTGRIVPNEPFPINLHIDASSSGEFDVNLDFKSNVHYLIAKAQLKLDDIELALNEFVISGQLQLQHGAAQPALRFNLASQNLDVDDLLSRTLVEKPAAETSTTSTTTSQSKDEDVQIALPMETLRKLDIDGKFAIKQLKAQNLTMSDVDLTIKAKNGLLALDPFTMNLYGGSVKTTVAIDVKSAVPKYRASKTLKTIQIGDLLKDFSGEDTLSGSLSGESEVTTRGEWLSELKKNSNGDMKLAFLDGALKGFNLRHSIDTAKARLANKEPPSKDELKTDFSSLTVSGVIKNGVFSSDDLDLQAPLLRVGGKGSANLNNETVDYLVNAKLVDSVEGQQGDGADQLSGLSIPVEIKGPFTDPKIDVQLDELLKGKVDAEKAKLKAEIAKQKEALKKQIEAEKKALAASKKRELEKRKELEKAKLKKKKEEAKKKAKEELLKKLSD